MSITAYVAPGCNPAAFLAARDAIGSTDPDVLRGASHTAERFGVKDQLRLDWPNVQIQYIGMGESVAYGFEALRLRKDALALLDTAIRDPRSPSDLDKVKDDLEQVSILAAVTANQDQARIPGTISCAVAASPWSQAHAFVYTAGASGAGRAQTASPSDIAKWLPGLGQIVVVRLASLVDGVARLVLNPVYGEEEPSDADPVAMLRLHARFGSSHG